VLPPADPAVTSPPQPRRPFRRRVARNTAAVGAANVWAIAVTLIALPLQLRGLGPVAFGTWALLQTFSAVNGWLSLADIGVGTATTRAVAGAAAVQDSTRVAMVVDTALLLFLALGTVAAILVATVGSVTLPVLFRTPPALVGVLRWAIPLFAVQVAFDFLTQGLQSTLEGFQRVELSRLVDSSRRTSVAVVTCVVALRGGGLGGVVAASAAASAAGTLLGAVLLFRVTPLRIRPPSLPEARRLISYGSGVAVLSTTGVVVRTMDRLIVGLLLGPGPVSLVEIATQVVNGASAVLSACSYSVTPAVAWVKAAGHRTALGELMVRGTKYTLLITVPVIVGTMALAGPLTRLWVGARFADAVVPMEIGLAALLLAAPLQVGSNLLQGVGKVRAMLVPVVGAHLVNLVASIVLVRYVGVAGVFIGTFIGTCIYVLPLARLALAAAIVDARDFLRDGVRPILVPAVALGLVATAAALIPATDLVRVAVGVPLAGAAYAALAWRLAVRPPELSDLRAMIR
jgi:O-antigen/teichoic acid export membrane protein